MLAPCQPGCCFRSDGNAALQNYGWGGRIIRDCVPHPFGAGFAVQIRCADLSNLKALILPPCHPGCCFRSDGNAALQNYGWGGRIRTCGCWYQKPVPYRLATPQQSATSQRRKSLLQGGTVTAARYESFPGHRQLPQQAFRLLAIRTAGKHTGTTPCHASRLVFR
jgi:hypothetical protein